MPGVGKEYEPNVELLRGIAISTRTVNPIYKDDESKSLLDNDNDEDEGANSVLYWKYFPKEALPSLDGEKFKAMFKEQDRWRLEDLEPYFDGQDLQSKLLEYTRHIEGEGDDVGWHISK